MNEVNRSYLVLVLDQPRKTVAWNKFASSCFCVPGLKQLAHIAGKSMSGLREDNCGGGGGLFDHNGRESPGAFFDEDECSSILSDMTDLSSCSCSSSDDGTGVQPRTICWSSASAEAASALRLAADPSPDGNSRDHDTALVAKGSAPRSKPPVSPHLLLGADHDNTTNNSINTSHHTSGGSTISCGSRTFVVTNRDSFLSSSSVSVASSTTGTNQRHRNNRARSDAGDDSSASRHSLGGSSNGSLHRRTSAMMICSDLSSSEGGEPRKAPPPKLPPLPPRPKQPQQPLSTSVAKQPPRKHRRSDTDASALEMKELCGNSGSGGNSGSSIEEPRSDPDGGGNKRGPNATTAAATTRKRRSPLPPPAGDIHRKPPKQPYASCDHLKATDFLCKARLLERAFSSATTTSATTTVLSGWIVALFGARAVSVSASNSVSSYSNSGRDRFPGFGPGDLFYLRIAQRECDGEGAKLVLHEPTDGRPLHSLDIAADWILRSTESGDRRVGRSVLLEAGPNALRSSSGCPDKLVGSDSSSSGRWILRLIPVALSEGWKKALGGRLEEKHSASAATADDALGVLDPVADDDEGRAAFVLPGRGRFAPDAQLDTARHLFFTIDSLVKQQQQQQQQQQK